jgi:vacuolar-type H+-ATPase subunit H
MNEVASGVEAIEVKAEKILEEARTKANEILLKAKEEARRILSSQLSMDEVKTECDEITHRARLEAEEKIADSEKKASEISINADKKVEGIVDLIVSIITGVKSR